MTILGKMEQYAKEGINLLQKIVGLLKEIKTILEQERRS